MENKIITIIDLDNDHNQYIESLIIANILEKKCENLCLMDLNPYNKDRSFFDISKCKEKDEIYTLKLFDRCNYTFPSFEALSGLKMNNLAKVMSNKNDILLISASLIKFDINSFFFDLSTDIILFVDVKKDPVNKMLKFFINNKLSNKHTHVYVYNFQDNMQDQKIFALLIKQFKSKTTTVETIKDIAKFKSLDSITNIDPWEDIYKKINGAF